MQELSNSVLAQDIDAINSKALPYIEQNFPGAQLDIDSLNIECDMYCVLAQVSEHESYTTARQILGLSIWKAIELRFFATGDRDTKNMRYAQLNRAWRVVLAEKPGLTYSSNDHSVAA